MIESQVEPKTKPAEAELEQPISQPRQILHILGPGLVTGASDDDPSCIGTLAQTGAAFGYAQLWMPPFAFLLMGFVQEMCSRIGLQTGSGLAGNLRERYPRSIVYVSLLLLTVANTITIGADLGAMAAAAHLLFDLPIILWLVAIPLVSIGFQVFTGYGRYQQVLRILAASLLVYVVIAFTIPQNWGEVLRSTVVPTIEFNRDYLMNIVAIFGSVLSPYLYFWQMSQEVEHKIDQGRVRNRVVEGVVTHVASKGINRHGVERMRLDVVSGMLMAGLVAWSVIVTMAATLHRQGILEVESAADAARALQPLAGDFSYILFAAGIIGVGLLALPVLAGSLAYAAAETFNLRSGLSLKLLQAPGFYGIIIGATVVGAAINLTGINPIRALYYASVVNGIAAPVVLTMVMLIGGNRKLMQDKVNSRLSKTIGWITTAVMAVSASALLVMLVFGR